jgi:allophanate hydrolase
VPAALNNVVGLKPTLGALSTRGVVPACRTLDAVSVFALTVDDAHAVFAAAAGFDAEDPYARPVAAGPLGAAPPRPRVGVPSRDSRRFHGDEAQARAFAAACATLEALGATLVEIDFAPFHEVAELLYAGPWLAERLAVIEPLLARDPEAVHPVIRRIVAPAAGLTATEAFRAFYRLEALRRRVEPALDAVDLLCVPSIPSFCSLADVAADPVGANARLGTYTNFVNLLGLCGLAVPMPPREDGRPGGVTLLARGGRDALVASLGRRLERTGFRTLGATGWPVPDAAGVPAAALDEIEVAVCGAHMSGLALNHELTRLGARFLREARTIPAYRLYALAGGPPRRPGLLRSPKLDSAAIRVEVWALPSAAFGAFMAGIPAPLTIGTVALADGTTPKGFLCEPAGTVGATDVSDLGDWRLVLAEAVG